MESFDLVVIGGGIHGCGVAVDAAGRGLRVALFEKNDLGSGTSSASTKLIHGGLRYLESYEFNLVRQCLIEQQLLLRNSRHLVEPLPFVIPIDTSLRPQWFVRAGLFFYDTLTRRNLPRSSTLSKEELQNLQLKITPKAAFKYYDCLTDDNRLVIGDALLARELGAKIYPRHPVTSIISTQDGWVIKAQGYHGPVLVKTKAIANMTGPWLKNLINDCHLPEPKTKLKLVQGSHLIVKKLYEGDHAIAHQHHDGRLIFFVPYEKKFTLVGTTDYSLHQMPNHVEMSNQEYSYLQNVIKDVFGKIISNDDFVSHYAGVRALIDTSNEASKTTREFKIEKMKCPHHQHPIVHVFGGKITTWRMVSEQIVDSLKADFPQMKDRWTINKIIPGARLNTSAHDILNELTIEYPKIPLPMLARYAKTYGLKSFDLLNGKQEITDLGHKICPGLYQQEVDYLTSHEWVEQAEDLLFRRTKLGYHLSKDEMSAVYSFFGQSMKNHPINKVQHSIIN
jgi:glycerol-3-phosphate dehydrogenase